MYDTIYNPTNVAAQYQFTFHLDAELYTLSSASEWLDFSFNNGAGFQTQLGFGGAGTYSFVDQTISTGMITVAANSYTTWERCSQHFRQRQHAGTCDVRGRVTHGFVDAGNTLSLTAISIFDSNGNPLTSSRLTSCAGFDYSQSNTGATPEPATAALMVGALAILGWAAKEPALSCHQPRCDHGINRVMSNPHPPPVPLDPVAAYDAVAADFHNLVAACRPWLDAIDQLVLANLPQGASLLDVGAGDARRARSIAKAAGIGSPVLLEPSPGMRQASPSANGYVNLRAEQLDQVTGKFDAILCLWNVFGHILPEAARLEALRQIKRLLAPNGRLFLDVNHRYNARRYGWRNTIARFLIDSLRASEHNGDVVAAWNLGGKQTRVRGHVFTHKELQKLINAAGLAIDQRFVVDYATGQLCPHAVQGNLLYIIRADDV